jgi:hypothetical protein
LQKIYKVGFWGGGVVELPGENAAGNTWFGEIMDDANVPKSNRYPNGGVTAAMWDLFRFLDVNNDYIITQSEIDGLALTVCGFSWGGPAALLFTQNLSQPGTIVVGGSPHNPISYNLQVPVPVKLLLTIDPVPIAEGPLGTIPSTVSAFANRYQQKGGYSIFRDMSGNQFIQNPTFPPGGWGSTLSTLFTGVTIEPIANYPDQVRVDTTASLSVPPGLPFDPSSIPELQLFYNEVSHGSMPWFVKPWAIAMLS